MWVPRSIRGGAELDPILVASRHRERFLRRSFRGWVLMAAALAIGTGAAYLGDEAVANCSATNGCL
jgi:hypothetical protein